MKPLQLELKNIGPFRQETIDFTKLGDMFLICGKTGAGKSTIFNSITYALYGRLPGERSKVTGNELRSDFVLHLFTSPKLLQDTPNSPLTPRNKKKY